MVAGHNREPQAHDAVLRARERLQVRCRKRKRAPIAQRQSLGGPSAADWVRSMDSIFDRMAKGIVIKSLTVVDDATHEAMIVVSER